MKLGYDVYRPLNDGTRYDLIIDIDGRLLRVQCKWGSRRGDVISIHCCRSRRTATGHLKRAYTAGEVDAFGIYCAELDRCYLLPIDGFSGQKQIRLRLAPARNNQREGIHWAEAYEFAARLGHPGP